MATFRVVRLFAATAAFVASAGVGATCLGLPAPAARNLNICERLAERLVVPQFAVSCQIPWWAYIFAPHCALPAACTVDPVCKSFEVTVQTGEIVFNAGDLYCDFRSFTPEKVITGIRDEVFTDAVKLTTGGTTSVLFDVANRHLDLLACGGAGLNARVQEWITCATAATASPPETYFSPVDIRRAILVNQSDPTAALYLRPGFAAITLDDVIITNSTAYAPLRSWTKPVGASLTAAERSALELVVHELVHVRQYRNMGRDSFLTLYLAEAIQKGYSSISSEQEARNFAASVSPRLQANGACSSIAPPPVPPPPPPPPPPDSCEQSCADEHSACLSEAGSLGAPSKQACVRAFQTCNANCR